MSETNNRLSEIWTDYEKSLSADESISLKSEIKQNIDFYEGRQWGKVKKDSKTAHMPRPVINLCQLSADTKKAALTAGNTKLQYKSYVDNIKARNLTNFVNYLLDEMDFEGVKAENVYDFVVKGSSAFHCYWDNEAVQTAKGHNGGIVIENISPLNIHFANSKERNIQKQEWIIVSREIAVDKAKQYAETIEQKELITQDNTDNNSKTVTLLTKYYRVKDKESNISEVWFVHATRSTVLGKPQKIHNAEYCEFCKKSIQSQTSAYLNNQTSQPPKIPFIRKASLYPIAFASCLRREDNVKGRGIITDIIPNQRAINFNLAMMLVSVMNTAWGQRVVREGALRNQEITNDPSQILVDYCKDGNGIYNIIGQPFSQSALLLNDNLLNLTRTMTGTTEVMTGENKAGQSGVAIAQLQEKANKIIDDMRKSYNRGVQQLGKILELFVAIFYDENEAKTYYSKDEKAENEEHYSEQIYIGTQNADKDYSCLVSVGNGSVYSEAIEMQVLYELFAAGKIDLETYLNNLPIDILPNKQELLRQINSSQEKVILQLRQQLKQVGEIASNIVPTIKENKSLNELLAQLQAEYTAKINEANNIIMGGNNNEMSQMRTTNADSSAQV